MISQTLSDTINCFLDKNKEIFQTSKAYSLEITFIPIFARIVDLLSRSKTKNVFD